MVREKREVTTIKLSKKTVEILNKLKIHPRQPYEEVILKYITEDAKKEEKPKKSKT